MYLTPEEYALLKDSEVYQRFSDIPLASQSATTITTAILAITKAGATLKNMAILKYLYLLREVVAQDSAGQRKVVESNSAYGFLAAAYGGLAGEHYHFPTLTQMGSTPTTFLHVPFVSAITADGSGNFANQSLLAASGDSKYGMLMMKWVKASANCAAGATLVFESPAGTPAAPSICAMPALVANTIDKSYDGVIVNHASHTANQAIVVDGAGWGNGTVVTVGFESWYEV